jgi:hypothetical protein
MKSSKIYYYFVFGTISLFIKTSGAFVDQATWTSNRAILSSPTGNKFLRTQLNYRNHDENDDASSMAVLKSRTTPSFKEIDLRPKFESKKDRGINYSLLFAMFMNQIFVLSLAVSLSAVYLYVTEDSQFLSDGVVNWSGNVVEPLLSHISDPSVTAFRCLEGVLGSIPMILFGMKLETSDDRRFAKANFSTIFMVMTLFGRRSQVASPQMQTRTIPNIPKTKFDRLEPLTKWIGKVMKNSNSMQKLIHFNDLTLFISFQRCFLHFNRYIINHCIMRRVGISWAATSCVKINNL